MALTLASSPPWLSLAQPLSKGLTTDTCNVSRVAVFVLYIYEIIPSSKFIQQTRLMYLLFYGYIARSLYRLYESFTIVLRFLILACLTIYYIQCSHIPDDDFWRNRSLPLEPRLICILIIWLFLF